jgi:hypothetical protein
MTTATVLALDARSYLPHALHRVERSWGESNCYIDVWIEVLHALGCEPSACLGFVLGLDWEGDQFTFFKPPLEDLFELYGVEVQELTVYKPLLDNALTQVRGGRMPDTKGTDYRTNHVKTTVGIQSIDVDRRELGYFHNAGYHLLSDADFVGLFRLDVPPDPTHMPFFAELVRTRRVRRLEEQELVRRATSMLRKHLARRPAENPIHSFGRAFVDDVGRLRESGLAAYHVYAFATIRQLGAAFELAAHYLRWLGERGVTHLEPSAQAFDAISSTSKSLILKTARAVSAKKALDLTDMLHDLETQWSVGMDNLEQRYGN